MELIKPAEISAKIMTLFDEADEELIIISPYNDLKQWVKMKRHLEMAINRNIKVEYYVRANTKPKGILDLCIDPIFIKDLHAKLYMNEKYAIVTSMNLVHYSNNYSLDIGYYIDGSKELDDLREFYMRHIKPNNENVFFKEPLETTKILIKDEKILKRYYPRSIKGKVRKDYYTNSNFLKSYGFVSGNQKIDQWLYFQENGLLNKVEYYEEGFLNRTEEVEYNEDTSLYFIMITLVNIIGGLYKVSVAELYFDSEINDYSSGNNAILYNYLNRVFNIQLSNNHWTLQELIDEIKVRLNGGLSNQIQEEKILLQYFKYYINEDIIDKMEFIKKYHYQMDFIKYCGFKDKGYDGAWLYFDSEGFCEREKRFDNGTLLETKYIDYDEYVSRYHIMFSLVNIVGSLYKKQVYSLYFDSIVSYYTNNNPQLLYQYLESHLKIKLSDYEHTTFQELVNDIKQCLEG